MGIRYVKVQILLWKREISQSLACFLRASPAAFRRLSGAAILDRRVTLDEDINPSPFSWPPFRHSLTSHTFNCFPNSSVNLNSTLTVHAYFLCIIQESFHAPRKRLNCKFLFQILQSITKKKNTSRRQVRIRIRALPLPYPPLVFFGFIILAFGRQLPTNNPRP